MDSNPIVFWSSVVFFALCFVFIAYDRFIRPQTPDEIRWFEVAWDENAIHLDVRPPRQEAWQESIPWESIIRVCYQAEDFTMSDGIYIFTSTRPESWVIPTEAIGGSEFVGELVRRELYDLERMMEAISDVGKPYCWPREEASSQAKPQA